MIRNLNKFGFCNFIEKMMQITKKSSNQPQSTNSHALAEKVLQKIGQGAYKVEYESKLRAKVSLESKIQELERELKEEIVKALKNTEQKLVYKIKVAEKAQEYLNSLKVQIPKEKWEEGKNKELIDDYHSLLKECEQARYDLIVHRHSAGFTIKNYQMINAMYKIPPKFVV